MLPALVQAFETQQIGHLALNPSFNMRLGLQYGTGIHFGHGALDSPGETERSAVSMSVKPRLGFDVAASPDDHMYGGLSVVAATTQLDGDIGGQFARSGDYAVGTDESFVGWRNENFDLSYGAQSFWVGDGFLIGDGNFDTGANDGQSWNFPYDAWRNSAIFKAHNDDARGEVFWLRSDRDYGDARVVGVNIENIAHDYPGVFGFMYLDIVDGNTVHFDGIKLWNLRAHNLSVPGLPQLKLWAEVAIERGRDRDGSGNHNAALGWYIEGAWAFDQLPWQPTLNYRYIQLSGDDPRTSANEEFRGLFFTFYKRAWDTWYQGEIASEYHLFNENQITQMVKLRASPRENWYLSLYYYRHDLDTPQFLGTPVSSTAWADEINFGVEYLLGERFFGYAGVAWSRPDTAAREIFGNDDFTVIQTFLMVTF